MGSSQRWLHLSAHLSPLISHSLVEAWKLYSQNSSLVQRLSQKNTHKRLGKLHLWWATEPSISAPWVRNFCSNFQPRFGEQGSYEDKFFSLLMFVLCHLKCYCANRHLMDWITKAQKKSQAKVIREERSTKKLQATEEVTDPRKTRVDLCKNTRVFFFPLYATLF